MSWDCEDAELTQEKKVCEVGGSAAASAGEGVLDQAVEQVAGDRVADHGEG